MADADEPWLGEWINSVVDDMMREHSYMEVSLRGSELVSVSLTGIGATCACLLDESTGTEIWPPTEIVGHQGLASFRMRSYASLSLTRYAAAAVAVLH